MMKYCAYFNESITKKSLDIFDDLVYNNIV